MARQDNEKRIVYRYTDLSDGIIKYVGITSVSIFGNRIYAHQTRDKWWQNKCWKIEYFECDNQSEAEAFEAHLIALYKTGDYYNKQKVGWGLNKYLPDVEDRWQTSTATPFDDALTQKAVKLLRALLRKGRREEAMLLLECFDLEDIE